MAPTKLKPVLPSLREKKRYLVFEVISRQKFQDPRPVSDAILRCSSVLLGEIGAAKAGIMPLENKWNAKNQRGMLKVGHKYSDAAKASLAFVREIGGHEAICMSIGLSGMLGKAEKQFLAGN